MSVESNPKVPGRDSKNAMRQAAMINDAGNPMGANSEFGLVSAFLASPRQDRLDIGTRCPYTTYER